MYKCKEIHNQPKENKMNNTTNTVKKTKKALLTMGLPGAGKSFVIASNYNSGDYRLIDPDEIKKEKADYNDKNPSVYHEWSKKVARLRMEEAIFNNENLIIDGTGTNVERMVKTIQNLQAQGYKVEVVYVKVKLATSLQRNRERARNVPENVIYEKFETIGTAFEIVSGVADIATIINND